MKKLVIFAIIVSTSIFTACGGGDSNQPPPNVPQIDPQSLSTLNSLIQKLQNLPGACRNLAVQAVGIISLGQQQPGSFPLPPSVGPQLSSLNDPTCNDAIKNAIWTSTRIQLKNGSPWINDPASKMWLMKRLAGVINQFAPLVAQTGLNPTTFMTQFAPQMAALTSGLVARLGVPGLAQQIPSFGQQVPAYPAPQAIASGYLNIGQPSSLPPLYSGSPLSTQGYPSSYPAPVPGYASSFSDPSSGYYGTQSPYGAFPTSGYPNLGLGTGY